MIKGLRFALFDRVALTFLLPDLPIFSRSDVFLLHTYKLTNTQFEPLRREMCEK